MTTLTAERSLLSAAEPADILAVLRSSYSVWGCGMPKEDYVDWMRMQLGSYWFRKNVRMFVAYEGDKIACSCKFYKLSMQSRGRLLKLGGIGALYTLPEHRGRGHASRMLNSLERLARQEGYDALLLFSDIYPGFYEQAGYELLGDREFYLWLSDAQVEQRILCEPSFAEDLQDHDTDIGPLSQEAINAMLAHYTRYAATVVPALVRDEFYWRYKLTRELFLQSHSSSNRPQLECLSMELQSPAGGYAIFEQSDKIMRVLEVIGRAEAREMLWRNILRLAMLRRVQLIRGWEAVAPVFVKGLHYVEREAARPMLLPLGTEAKQCLQQSPCPLLELDHF